MFDKRGAAFHPIAIVQIHHAIHGAHLGVMDMAANHAVKPAGLGVVGERGLKPVDRLHRLLHLQFQPGGERPVRIAELAAQNVEIAVRPQGNRVGPVTQQGQGARVAHNAVEAVTMGDQQALAICRGVLGLHLQLHAANLDAEADVFAQHLVMVAGHVHNVGAGARGFQNQLQHLIVVLVPEPGALEAPAIDNVANQKQILARGLLEEICQELRPATPRAHMHVGYEDATISRWTVRAGCVHGARNNPCGRVGDSEVSMTESIDVSK